MISRAAAPALTALCGAALLLSGCTAQPIPQPPPPPPAVAEAPPAPGEPRQDETGLLGGPPAPGAESGAPSQATVTYRQGEGVVVSTLRTIPEGETAAPPPAAKPRRQAPPPPRTTVRPQAQAPAQTRAQAGAAERQAPVVEVTPPGPLVSATPPQTRAADPSSTGPLAEAPKTPFVQPLPLKAPADPTLAALQRVLKEETARGSTLAVPTVVTQGGSGQVSLRLPAALMARLQAEAAKLGLAPAARTAEVTARLSGDGYEITPSQNQTAPLKPGEEIVFNWRVEPAAAPADGKTPAKAPPPGALTAQADAALTGEGKARSFPLVALEQAPAEAQPAPAGGETSAKWVLVSILVLLAALVLGGVFRNHAERRRAEAERRRREQAARTFEAPRPLSEATAEAAAKAGSGAESGAASDAGPKPES